MNESSDSSAGLDAQNNGGFLEAAASHIRRGLAADPKHAQEEVRETALQIRLFRAWALETGCLISADRLPAFPLVSDSTSEHKVFFDPARNRAIKQTLPGQFGWIPKRVQGRWTLGIGKPLDYLQRWILFNAVFGDDVRLEGVTISGSMMVIGDETEPLSTIISQPWHRASPIDDPAPTPRGISQLLHRLGFQPLPDSFHGWERAADGVVLLDARPENFINTENGIAPIDLPMMRAE